MRKRRGKKTPANRTMCNFWLVLFPHPVAVAAAVVVLVVGLVLWISCMLSIVSSCEHIRTDDVYLADCMEVGVYFVVHIEANTRRYISCAHTKWLYFVDFVSSPFSRATHIFHVHIWIANMVPMPLEMMLPARVETYFIAPSALVCSYSFCAGAPPYKGPTTVPAH